MALVSQVLGILDRIAPPYLKYEKDNIGLQVGSKNAQVYKILVTLEVTDEVVVEAKDKGVQLIVSHHPLIFRGLNRVLAEDHIGGLVTALITSGISLIAAHTNLDRAREGVSDVLAHIIELQDIEVLVPAKDITMYKLVVFIPAENVEEMISALGNVGAGVIGNYSHCTFRTGGMGTFYPMEGAQPYLGMRGELNQVEEARLEVLVEPDKIDNAVKTMLDIHPYEEPAYDIYEVKTPPAGIGFGRVGNLVKPRSLRECVEHWSEQLDSDVRVSGSWDMVVKRVAVCGGSGADLIGAAKAAGADVYITGDIKYHAAHEARAMGLAVVDAGHAETERLVVPELARQLQNAINGAGLKIDVIMTEIDTSPWNKG